MTAEKNGKHSIACVPDAKYHRGCLKAGCGFAMLYSKPYIDSAEDLVPEIESVLSELISYHVSAEDASRFLGEKYLGFRIKAT